MFEHYNHKSLKLNSDETWDFLDIIYETAHDPGFWPLALEGLKTELDALDTGEDLNNLTPAASKQNYQSYSPRLSQSNTAEDHKNTPLAATDLSLQAASMSNRELSLVSKLQPHFKRALDINHRYQSLKDEKDITASLLDRIPLGIIFTTSDGRIITQNAFATTLMQSGNTLSVKDGSIHTNDSHQTQQLLSLINTAHHTTNANCKTELNSIHFQSRHTGKNDSPLSVLVTPHVVPNALATQQRCVVLFVVSDNTEAVINEKALKSIFNLSSTEAIIAKYIASGKTLKHYCDERHVSLHTVRSQLKSIFSKTNTHSQSELSNRILTSPAIFVETPTSSSVKQQQAYSGNTSCHFPDDKQFLNLPDGRTLCYVDVGDKNGLPVVLCHGGYGCRKERYPDDRIARELGIRLIVPDRPGFGLSTPLEQHNSFEWCQDFEFLLDHLNINNTHILSTGSGSYFALACAHEKPNKVTGLTLVNSMAPFKSVKEFSGMIPHEKLFYAMARHTPRLFTRFAELSKLGLSKNIDWYFDSIKSYGSQRDSDALSDDGISAFIKDKVFTAYDVTNRGTIQETILLAKPWQMDLTSIKTEIEIYHGGSQVAIPSSMSQRLASLLPNNRYHFDAEQGTYLLYLKWRSFLNSIKRCHNS